MADVFANNRSILHKGDGNQHVSGPPDVCKTPSPGGPVPIPYPNIAMDSDLAGGAKTVKIHGNPVAHEGSNLRTSTGDEPGTAGGGIASNKTKGKLTWGSSSGDVKVEGKGVARFMDVTEHNGNVFNTVITALGEVIVPGYGDDPIDVPNCVICTEPKSKHRLEANELVIDLAQRLATNLRDASRPFAKAFRNKSNTGPLKKGVMIGVLVCQCDTKNKYAGLAGTEYSSGAFLASANAFATEASALGLTPVFAAPPQPPLTGASPPGVGGASFGGMSGAQWNAIKESVETTHGEHGRGNPALTCAAPKMAQKCLADGHKPGAMIEIWVGMKPESSVDIPRYMRVVIDQRPNATFFGRIASFFGFDWSTSVEEWKQDTTFGDGAAVPSCTTCQVVQTTMLCNLGQPPCP